MKKCVHIVLLFLTLSSCQSQNDKEVNKTLIGGSCEGCEAIHEYGDVVLSSIDTLPDFDKYQPQIKIFGIVYQKDGKTPASDVIIYIYHTNREGIYPTKQDSQGWAKRHGYHRGWVKSDAQGKYTFYTFRPASYPNRAEPEHIHITVKEPNKNEYYLNSYVFDDDPLLITSKRNQLRNRGGSGIVMPVKTGDIYHIERDLILGENIPNYR